MNRSVTIAAACAFAVLLSGCAATDPSGQNDPYEQTNRKVFALNQDLDHNVARPVAVFYTHAVPGVARDGLHNVLQNLDSPVIFANDLLQGETTLAGQTLGRAVVNSTLGLGGLVDLAGKIGIPAHENDFGITLGVWGVKEGPYLVLPAVGPDNPRDVVGAGGDIAMSPLTYINFSSKIWYDIGRQVFEVIDLRARNLDTLDQIERTSVDLYATTRSLYRQHRNSLIRHGAPDTENLPNL
jgi:phospholipid-binding lipoprotein MlaA